MDKETADLLRERIHPKIKSKTSIWNLLDDSYTGGVQYINNNHLFQYSRENNEDYKNRKARSVYFNHVQPLADMLVGFLFAEEPERRVSGFEYLIEKANRKSSFESFIQRVATLSLLFTVGVLVDSPQYDKNQIKSVADRKSNDLNPYCVFYHPTKIKDFKHDDNGDLIWLLLNNSYTEKTNPLIKEKDVEIYRLWQKGNYIDILFDGKDFTYDEVEIDIDQIPFIFANWRDVDQDFISDSIFEDIALLSRQIYNYISYLDESIASSSFKNLFYPIESEGDLPDEFLKSGMAALSVVPFNGALSGRPFFDSPSLNDLGSIITVVEMYVKEILSKVGLDKDQERNYVQSGIAKRLEFEKCETILRLGATQMEQVEKQIFKYAALWEGKGYDNVDINYIKKFQSEAIEEQLSRLYDMFTLPVERIKELALNLIVQKTLNSIGEDAKGYKNLKIEDSYEERYTSDDEK